ncbi:ribonuclease P protein component [Gordonia sp. NB41Y]|uniref:ribonuclease P protein component n=1 Tax=Gordonia sp. NB41Y TaxID=875808 RepID=UPI0002BD478E|nr:ribonuclease P protein component [Gordonia sp. NB41Y]EMP14422.1 ribonuclease P [Gordonia sp. NB41Y]WLP88499.1 ribonuclease P protein component [Gordonia sp. NB41Y]
MMSAGHRISRGSDFARTLKKGVRVSTHDLVVSVAVVPATWPDPARRRRDVAMIGGPWLGLIVSKSVGSAVVRHQVARRLRAAFASVIDQVPATESYVVIRALPGAATLGSPELAAQLSEALGRGRIRRLAPPADAEVPV